LRRVVYRKLERGAGASSAPALSELLLSALLGFKEETASSPLASGDEERLRQALVKEIRRRTHGDLLAAKQQSERLLQRLLAEGWLERRGQAARAQFLLSPMLLRALQLKALRRLLAAPPPREPGAWPLAGPKGSYQPHGAVEKRRWGERARLDASATLKAALRHGLSELRVADLRVRRGEGGKRTALALLLDCSHSMVLYGEDRFTPAKLATLALSALLRMRGGLLRVFCIHDDAEVISERRLPFVGAAPSHTNTAAALELAASWLRRNAADERQAVLISDGHPTAVRLADGGLYRNAWGFDEVIRRETLARAAALRRVGATLTVYLLADEERALRFSRELARVARGRLQRVPAARLGGLLLRLGRG